MAEAAEGIEMTPERLADADSLVRCLVNFGGNMPRVRYDEAADLVRELRAEVARLRAQLDIASREVHRLNAEVDALQAPPRGFFRVPADDDTYSGDEQR